MFDEILSLLEFVGPTRDLRRDHKVGLYFSEKVQMWIASQSLLVCCGMNLSGLLMKISMVVVDR